MAWSLSGTKGRSKLAVRALHLIKIDGMSSIVIELRIRSELVFAISKAWFPYGRNCRERVGTVVRVVLATKWKHEEKSCRDTLATVQRQLH
jgi:hypothetical protein